MIHSFIPQGILKDYVYAILYLEGIGTGLALQRVYPNIIINLGDNFRTSDPNLAQPGTEQTAAIWINGKHERPFHLENPGKARFYVIAVKPGLLPHFISLPVSETNDKALSAEHWCGPGIFELRQKLLHVSDMQRNFQAIEQYFSGIIQPADASHQATIKFIADSLETHTVEEMCRQLNCSRKKLWQVVNRAFGSPVKPMQGIIRFDRHLAAMAKDHDVSLSALHEFYDQAHFINDFKKRTGMTPKQYRLLCKMYPETKRTPNFIPVDKETFLQFCLEHQR